MDLAAAGFDLVHRFAARDVARELALPLLDDAERPVGILVGNTRALWSPFAAALAADRELATCEHPIERYAEQVVRPAAAALGGVAYFAHERHGGAFLPFQRIAAAAGLAALAPTQLLVHPTYGPWLGLRAVILAPGDPPPPPPRIACSCACSEHGCVAAFERARERPEDWRLWLAMRDACPIGRAHRYGEQQIAYHYTKDRRYLPLA